MSIGFFFTLVYFISHQDGCVWNLVGETVGGGGGWGSELGGTARDSCPLLTPVSDCLSMYKQTLTYSPLFFAFSVWNVDETT